MVLDNNFTCIIDVSYSLRPICWMVNLAFDTIASHAVLCFMRLTTTPVQDDIELLLTNDKYAIN